MNLTPFFLYFRYHSTDNLPCQEVLSLHIKCRVHIIYIFLIQLFPQQLNGFAEALEMDDLPFPEEFDHVIDVRIIGKPQNIVVSDAGFLFWHAQSFATK